MNHDGAARPDADVIRALERSNYHPLWDRYKRITPLAPLGVTELHMPLTPQRVWESIRAVRGF